MNTRRTIKVFGWVLLGILAIPIALYLAALVVNRHDQAPSASAALLHDVLDRRATIPDEENGYIYVLGFPAAIDADPQALGLRRVAWLNGRGYLPGSANQDPLEHPIEIREKRSPELKALTASCGSPGIECIASLEKSPELLAEWLASEATLLDRYRALLTRDGWLESVPYDARMPLPAYSHTLDGQRLLFAYLWQQAGSSEPTGIREALQSDLVFWRHVLASSDLLITKMIATAALRQHFAMGNLVLRRLPPDQIVEALPPQWKQALSVEERSMLRTAAGELVFAEGMLRDMWDPNQRQLLSYEEEGFGARIGNSLLLRLFQPQDSTNALADKYVKDAESFAVPLDEYPRALEALASEQPRRSFSRIYNIAGDILFDAGSGWHLGTYAVRVGDIEGMRRAALLTSELRAQPVPQAEIEESLRTSALRNPYDDEPFGWDDETQAIVFVGLEEGERGRHEYVY